MSNRWCKKLLASNRSVTRSTSRIDVGYGIYIELWSFCTINQIEYLLFLKQDRCLFLDKTDDGLLFKIKLFNFPWLTYDYRFGRPGVEFYGQHTIESGENAVTKIIALPNEVSIIITTASLNIFLVSDIIYKA